MDSVWLMLLLQVVLIALNAVFASAEIAIISMNDNKLAKMAQEGNKKAIKLAKLTSKPARFLATIQVAITLSGFLGSAFAADNFSDKLVALIMKTGINIPEKTLDSVVVILITLILSYFTLVFGELVPKRVAMRKAESLALGMASMITFISKAFAPLVFLLTASTNLVLRLMRIDPDAADDDVSEEDIRMMVDAGSEKGAIDSTEKEFIQNVFEFDDLAVEEIAVHRTEVSLLWMEESVEEWNKTINGSRHTMYPVCDETVDNIVGILNAKDYFRLADKSKENILQNAVTPAYFVPESIKADVLFKNMKDSRNTFAVVLDEHGGTTGIITMSDLLEQLVGDFDADRPEKTEPAIQSLDSKTWKILGTAELDDIERELGVSFGDNENNTFSGLIFDTLGAVADDGSSFELNAYNLIIKVTGVTDHQVDSAVVCLDLPLDKED